MRLILTLTLALILTSCAHTDTRQTHYSVSEIRTKAVGTWTCDAWHDSGGPSMITVTFKADGSFQSASKELASNFFDPFEPAQSKIGDQWIHKGVWRAHDGYIDVSKTGEQPATSCGRLLLERLSDDEMVCSRESEAGLITFKRKVVASTPAK